MILSLILDIDNLCLLCVLVSLAGGLLILLIFSSNQLFVSCFSTLFFLFSLSLISTLIIISFLLLTFWYNFLSLFFFKFLKVGAEMIDLRYFLIQTFRYYKFPSKYCFSCITQIVMFCFHFLSIQNTLHLPFSFLFDPWIVQ